MTMLAIDIETLERPIPEYLLTEKQEYYQKKAEGRYKKPEVIEAHATTDLEAWKANWKFTRRGAQVLCVGVAEIDHDGVCWDSIGAVVDSDEAELCRMTYELLTELRPQKIVTYNGFRFDLPILLTMFARHNRIMPGSLGKWDYIDLMKAGFEAFASESMKLDDMAELYGVEVPGDAFPVPGFPNPDGSQVAAMWEQDKLDNGTRVKNYCLQDVWKTAHIAHKVNSFVRL